MTVGIVGLGLIGGSFAKAYHAAGWTVYGYDVDESMLAFAQLADAVNAPLTMENIGTCDLVLLCVRPLPRSTICVLPHRISEAGPS